MKKTLETIRRDAYLKQAKRYADMNLPIQMKRELVADRVKRAQWAKKAPLTRIQINNLIGKLGREWAESVLGMELI